MQARAASPPSVQHAATAPPSPPPLPAYLLPDENAAQLLRRTRCPPLPTRISAIDACTPDGVGLRAGDALELFGASGSGKTELLYHIVLACIMPKEHEGLILSGAGMCALVLDVDCRFNLTRLSTILEARLIMAIQEQRPDIDIDTFFESDAAMQLMTSVLDRLLIMRCPSADGSDLMAALRHVSTLCAHEMRESHGTAPVRLVCIDNCGANYWIHKTSPDGMKWYDALAAELRRILPTNHLSLVMTKPQIFFKQGTPATTASTSSSTSSNSGSIYSSGDDSWYLGNALQQLCRTRVHTHQLKTIVLVGSTHESVWSGTMIARPQLLAAQQQQQQQARQQFHYTILRGGVTALEEHKT